MSMKRSFSMVPRRVFAWDMFDSARSIKSLTSSLERLDVVVLFELS